MVYAPTTPPPPEALGSRSRAEIIWRIRKSVVPAYAEWESSLLGEMNQGWTNQDDLKVVQGFIRGLPGARDALGDRLACISAYIEARNFRLGRPLGAAVLDDLRQDCHMAILQAAESYTGQSPLSAWAQGFVRYTFLKHFRKQRADQAILANVQKDFSEPETRDPEPQETSTITTVLAGLSEIERRTLSMRILEDMPFPEIAMILNEPNTTTKSRFVRLVVRLGPQLQTIWKSEYNEGN
jgi:RNA polymerase sigma factor (sigma-70 family)